MRLAVGVLLGGAGVGAMASPFQPVESIRAAALSTAEAGEEAPKEVPKSPLRAANGEERGRPSL